MSQQTTVSKHTGQKNKYIYSNQKTYNVTKDSVDNAVLKIVEKLGQPGLHGQISTMIKSLDYSHKNMLTLVISCWYLSVNSGPFDQNTFEYWYNGLFKPNILDQEAKMDESLDIKLKCSFYRYIKYVRKSINADISS